MIFDGIPTHFIATSFCKKYLGTEATLHNIQSILDKFVWTYKKTI